MDAALEVFGEKGLHGASVEDIARAAGIGKGTVYLSFKSKDEIFDAILAERWPGPFLDQALPEMLGGASSAGDSLDSTLEAVASGFLRAVEENMLILRLALSEAYRFPEGSARLFETTFLRANHSLANYIELQSRAGKIRHLDSPLVAARCFQGMLITYVLSQELMGGKKFTPITRSLWVKQTVNIFLNGILERGVDSMSDGRNGR